MKIIAIKIVNAIIMKFWFFFLKLFSKKYEWKKKDTNNLTKHFMIVRSAS